MFQGRRRLAKVAKRASDSAQRMAVASRESYERLKAYRDEARAYPIVKFHGPSAHAEFVRWTQAHPRGFVTNCKSDYDYMLHCADCSAFVFHDPNYCLTTNMKVCCLNRDRLVRWAGWRVWADMVPCSLCDP
jgi:hypothetical protein